MRGSQDATCGGNSRGRGYIDLRNMLAHDRLPDIDEHEVWG